MANEQVQVTINGEPVNLNPEAMIYASRTWVPLRGVFERMGAEVIWDQQLQAAIIKPQDEASVITFLTDDRIAQVFDTATKETALVDMGTEPLSVNGRLFVPLRLVSETLGANVMWDAISNTAVITMGDGQDANGDQQRMRAVIKGERINGE